MKRSTELLTALGLILTYTAFSVWLMSLAVVQNDYDAMGLRLVPVLLYFPIVYVINRFIAGRGANLSIYAVLELVFAVGAGLLFAKCSYFQPARTGALVFHSIFYALGTFCAAFAGFEPVKAKTLSICFDLLIIMMAIVLLLANYIEILITREVIIACCAALAAVLLALLAARIDAEGSLGAVSGSPAAGRLLLGAAVVLIAAIVVAAAFFALGGMQDLSQGIFGIGKAILGALKAAGIWLWEKFDSFIHWLAAMFPVDENYAPAEIMPSAGNADFESGMGDASLPAGAYVAAAIIGAAIIAGLIFTMRKINLRAAAPVRRSSARVRRKSELGAALRRLWAKLRAAFGFRLSCIKHSKTAPGLLVYCEKRAGKENRRRSGESGEKYLLRLAACGYPDELKQALTSLSSYVEREFYSRESVSVPEDIRRAIRHGSFKISEG